MGAKFSDAEGRRIMSCRLGTLDAQLEALAGRAADARGVAVMCANVFPAILPRLDRVVPELWGHRF